MQNAYDKIVKVEVELFSIMRKKENKSTVCLRAS